jgi:hypothetical protein
MIILLTLSGCSGCGNSKNYVTHIPYMNPGGIDFKKDSKFYESYKRLEPDRKARCIAAYPDLTKIGGNCTFDNNGIPNGFELLIEKNTVALNKWDAERLMKKLNGDNLTWFKENCVDNTDIPDDVKDLITSKCEAFIQQNCKEEDLPEPTTSNNCEMPAPTPINNCETPKYDNDIPLVLESPQPIQYSDLVAEAKPKRRSFFKAKKPAKSRLGKRKTSECNTISPQLVQDSGCISNKKRFGLRKIINISGKSKIETRKTKRAEFIAMKKQSRNSRLKNHEVEASVL